MAEEMDLSTKLAFDRTVLAHERTLMAWVRTATSLISFGFSIYKFFQAYSGTARPPGTPGVVTIPEYGGIVISLGIVGLIVATVAHRRAIGRLRAQGAAVGISEAHVMSLILSALGIAALVAVIRGW